ncbi:MAG: hypothetical protein PHV68_08885 [Candidatus Gastranaerophilales bacterium]|nr:hypothetical protein [Candidatus Gastranaerophilales bacterium]
MLGKGQQLTVQEAKIITGVWSEKILVITEDYEITGYVFLPKTSKKNRVLSDILNGKKRFIAIKDALIVHRNSPTRKAENHGFIQLNLSSITMLRPVLE